MQHSPADTPDPASQRRDYTAGGLSEGDLAATWDAQFARWYADASAEGSGIVEPNAVVLATAAADGTPSARTVLLKGFDARGLVVFTNLRSRKGRELQANPRASLCFSWVPLERQVVVVGDVEQVDRAETEDYFRSRPRDSQVGAWVSRQSEVIAGREVLEQRQAALEERLGAGPVPVPPFWGGLRVRPRTVEFWQGRPSRLHDRLRYDLTRGDLPRGVVERLSP